MTRKPIKRSLPAEDPVGSNGGASVPRFGHGSRVPGWDESVDLRKDPADVPDPATVPVPADLRAEIETHMAKYPDHRSAVIAALAAAQRHHGWCSPEAMDQVACVMRLTPGYVVSIATFYDMLENHPVGRHSVYVCTNISCSLCGAEDLLAAVEEATADDPDFNVRHFECLGACDLAPMASVDGVYVGPIALDEVPTLLAQVRGGEPVLPDKQLTQRAVADPMAVSPRGPTTYGGQMPEEAPGPPGAIEQEPIGPEEGSKQSNEKAL